MAVCIQYSFIFCSGGGRSTAVTWHQGIMGRNCEDVASAFVEIIKTYFDKEEIVLWLDNCSGQNKNWTLFTALTGLMNALTDLQKLQKITLKYFEKGHTFMSADSFHALVEKGFKKFRNVFNYSDYVSVMASVGNVKQMNIGDFKTYASGLSKGKKSKATRPYLNQVYIAQFRRGQTCMYFKKGHTECHFNEAEYLKNAVKKDMTQRRYIPSLKTKANPHLMADRKATQLTELVPLMPVEKRSFWVNL